jgi:hypothetical protein
LIEKATIFAREASEQRARHQTEREDRMRRKRARLQTEGGETTHKQ